MSAGLLDGVRVAEFSQLIAAPFCGLTLRDLGADVIKVEPEGGDPTRGFPPHIGSDESAFFHAFNRGKRGVLLDLAEPEGRETAARLIASADVVVENLGDASASLGIGYEQAASRNPRLVWCSITGRGRDTAGRAVDPSLQAAMGMISLTGEPDGRPVRIPVPLVDLMTGMYAVQSVLAALWRAERTGLGGLLDCAMIDTAATLTSTSALLAREGLARRLGGESPLVVPSAIFEASDGRHLQITCIGNGHWQGLCRALERPDLADDSRLADADGRLAHRTLVHDAVRAVIETKSSEHWIEAINAAGAICEPVRDIEEAWADPVLGERGLIGRLADPALDSFPLPVISLAAPSNADSLERGPRLGEHTKAVVDELPA